MKSSSPSWRLQQGPSGELRRSLFVQLTCRSSQGDRQVNLSRRSDAEQAGRPWRSTEIVGRLHWLQVAMGTDVAHMAGRVPSLRGRRRWQIPTQSKNDRDYYNLDRRANGNAVGADVRPTRLITGGVGTAPPGIATFALFLELPVRTGKCFFFPRGNIAIATTGTLSSLASRQLNSLLKQTGDPPDLPVDTYRDEWTLSAITFAFVLSPM